MDLCAERPLLDVEVFLEAARQQQVDGATELLKEMPLLTLCLLVAMMRRAEVHSLILSSKSRAGKAAASPSNQTVNFEMVYDEYKAFMSSAIAHGGGGLKLYRKPVALKAFEQLLELELVRAVDSNATKSPKEYRMVRMALDPLQVI